MNSNPIVDLEGLGQSIWVDFISRGMILSGELKELIQEDGISGVTSNPSIFEKAIAGSHDYDSAIQALLQEGRNAVEIFEELSTKDIQSVADLLHPVYLKLKGEDGFVSLEVSPKLAHNTSGTIDEARRLWKLVNRPNLMIKVPATEEGIPAIKQLISDGININITLLFGLNRYREVAEAYIQGLEERAAKKLALNNISSVASFFISRIDVLIDPLLEKLAHKEINSAGIALDLKGRIAIASAKIAYRIYREIFTNERFRNLLKLEARPQRLLWASTSTKNPTYSDIKYVEPLIGTETINTLPLETINAYRDHGNPHLLLIEGNKESAEYLSRLKNIGIDLDTITQQLEDEGVNKFITAYDSLLNVLKQKIENYKKELSSDHAHAA